MSPSNQPRRQGLLALVSAAFLAPSLFGADAEVSFTKEIAPVFVESCYACHNAKTKKGKYDMSTFDLLFKGGKNASIVVAGKPEESLLYQMIAGIEEPAMPKDADPLRKDVVAKIGLWIRQGAKFDGPNRGADMREMVGSPSKSAAVINPNAPLPVTALAFSPDGKMLATSGYHEILLFSTADGKLIGRLPTQCQRIHGLRFLPDGKALAHVGGTPAVMGEVVLWNLAEKKMIKQLAKIEDTLFALAIDPAGKQLAAAGADRIFRVWDLATHAETAKVENHADWVLGLAFSPDGKRLFSCGRDKSSKIWDLAAKEPVLTFPGHQDGVYGIAVSTDGKQGITVGADRVLRFWSAEGEGKEIRGIVAHGKTVHALAVSKTPNVVYTAGADKVVKAWNPGNGQHTKTYEGPKDWLYSLALSPDEKRIAAGAWDGSVWIWETESAKKVLEFSTIPSKLVASVAGK